MPDTPASATPRRVTALEHVTLALVAFVPQLLARPGVAVADTKSYLYFDPGRFLRQSTSMWDPNVGLGTVTHQQIGYLFPMGPYFWATHALGVPTWVAQRCWTALLLYAAGAGVLVLCRTLRLPAPASTVAALAYMLSPYFLQYVGRISAILLPWSALGWLLALVERGLRRGGWRHPAAIAVLAAAMSSINASGALYVGMAPVLWLCYAGVTRLHAWPRLWSLLWRTALLGVAASAWWMAGLAVEGGYGLDVLRYTETVPVVSSTSLSSEVARGLGYWYFYGGDALGPWVPTLAQFTQQLWLIGLGYSAAFLALAGAFVTRWRHRAFFVVLVVVGLVLAVGAYPFDSPAPAGRVLRDVFTHSTIGLAMRSTDRATPLVLLGLAMLLGAATAAVLGVSRTAALVIAGVALAAILASDPAVWDGNTVPTHFAEPGTPPGYVLRAAAALDTRHRATRVLAVPGEDFAAYRYGDTVDPVWPALLTRPFVTREQQVVMGSLAGEDLLSGFDDPAQNGVFDPATVAPLARLMSVGDVLVQNDLAYERYDQPDPAAFWSLFRTAPAGLGEPQGFGTPRPNVAPAKALDEQTLAETPGTPPPPPVAVLSVASPRPVTRTEPVAGAVVVDGDGAGLVAAAGVGLLAHDPPVLYAGTLDTHPAARAAVLPSASQLVVTDTNRKQAYRWNTLRGVAGRTLGAAEPQPADANDAPLDLFPGEPADGRSTTALTGVTSVRASSYGNSVAYLPEDRPVEALDGNLDTAWETGPFADPRREWWQVTLQAPTTEDHVTLVQVQGADFTQWVTAVTLRFDGGSSLHVPLGPQSQAPGGQSITFPARTFRTLRVTIDDTNLPHRRAVGPGASPVGFAEIAVPGVRATEQVVMPRDLLRAAGGASIGRRLTMVMTRQRVAPVPPRRDPEASLERSFWLPTARRFTLTGTARIDTLVPDATIDQLVGRPGSSGSGVVAYSLGRLPGDLRATASAALDGDLTTAWSPGLGAAHQVGQWLSVNVPRAVTFDHLDLELVADGRHSVPTELQVTTESGSATVQVPPVADRSAAFATAAAPVHFPALTGRHVTVTVLAARLEWTPDYYSGGRIALPLGIAELGIPAVRAPMPPPSVPSVCRSDVLFLDGRPVSIRLVGSSADALAGRGVSIVPCGSDAGGVALGPGSHTVRAAFGHATGVDLDQLVLDSADGGGPEAGDTGSALAATTAPPSPPLSLSSAGPTTLSAHVHGTDGAPYWVVLGQNVNPGWHATVTGGPSLDAPVLVDGFANGWLVTPTAGGGRHDVTVVLRWTPQRVVDGALLLSSAAAVACLTLVIVPGRRRRVRRSSPTAGVMAGPDPGAVAAHAQGDERPVLVSPLVSAGVRPPWVHVVGGALAAGAFAAVFALPEWGVAAAAVVAGCALLRPARAVVALASTGLVVACAVAMVVIQADGRFPADGNWPGHFGLAHTLFWGAVVLLGADVVAGALRRAADRRPR